MRRRENEAMLDGMLSDIGPSKIYHGKLDCFPAPNKTSCLGTI